MARSISYRRHQRQKRLAKADLVLNVVWRGSHSAEEACRLPIHKWADNLRKCSCFTCAGHKRPKRTPSLQELRATHTEEDT